MSDCGIDDLELVYTGTYKVVPPSLYELLLDHKEEFEGRVEVICKKCLRQRKQNDESFRRGNRWE
jgi:hypothetical protein